MGERTAGAVAQCGRVRRCVGLVALVVIGTGLLIALRGLLRVPIAGGVPGVLGMVVAIEVFRCHPFRGRGSVLSTTTLALACCLLASLWAAICQRLLCAIASRVLPHVGTLSCTTNVIQRTLYSSILFACLGCLILSLTLGRASLRERP